jgi:cathepsin B
VSANDSIRHEIISQINSDPTNTWFAKIHDRFKGTDFSYTKKLCGALPPKSGVRNVYHHVLTSEQVAAIPESFDAREAWPNCPTIKEIRDQSDCGSCWAFGAVEAASDRICIASNGALTPHLSAETLVACCDECGNGCNGGYPASAWDYFASTGVPSGGNYGDHSGCQMYSLKQCDHHTTGKYAPCGATEYPTPSCSYSCDKDSTSKVPFKTDAASNLFSTSYYVGSSESQIQTEIMTNGPVEAAFTVYADFESYSGGVYTHKTGEELGGHAIKILGWGVDNGVKYWLVANSWNNDW